MVSAARHNIYPVRPPTDVKNLTPTDQAHTSHKLDRGEALPGEIQEFKPDVILAADCVYFEPAFPLLLQTLKELLALCPSATVYFCFKKRRRADMQFLKNAKKAFTVTEVVDDDRPVFSREGLFLYTFTSREKTRPLL